jgi:hypothetical protein
MGGDLSALRGAGSALREKTHIAAEAETRLMAIPEPTFPKKHLRKSKFVSGFARIS